MGTLHRCDICMDLIDPVEGDERSVLQVALKDDEGKGDIDHIDLCEDCRPETLTSHMDWMIFKMENEIPS